MCKPLYFFVLMCLVKCGLGDSVKCQTSFDPVSLLNCSGLNLIDFPPSLSHLRDHLNVKKLLISHNNLNTSISFAEWKSLIALDVSYNNINQISSNTFGPLKNLKYLSLTHNNISVIDSNAFENLTILEILDLSGNPLLGQNYESFKNSLNTVLRRSLRKFTMTSSNLSNFPDDMFEFGHELQYLDLSDNNITLIPILPKTLIYFKINNNSIQSINLIPFQKSKLLKDLYIENNFELTSIHYAAFELLYNIRNISFKGCKNLTYLPSNLFYFNRKLRSLSFANCNLKSVPYTFRSTFLSIPHLELEGNPWHCNSSIKWFSLLNYSTYENIRCERPHNTTFIELYGSSVRRHILQRLLVGLVFLVFILFGLAIYVSFEVEKKRRLNQSTYVRLDSKNNPFVNPVYVTTVV